MYLKRFLILRGFTCNFLPVYKFSRNLTLFMLVYFHQLSCSEFSIISCTFTVCPGAREGRASGLRNITKCSLLVRYTTLVHKYENLTHISQDRRIYYMLLDVCLSPYHSFNAAYTCFTKPKCLNLIAFAQSFLYFFSQLKCE